MPLLKTDILAYNMCSCQGWEMGDVIPSDDDIKKEPVSPKFVPEVSTAVINVDKGESGKTCKMDNFQVNTLNRNNQVVVSAGNKILPIRGILLKPVNSAGTTTLISVPVSLTSKGTTIQPISSTNIRMAEQEKPAVDNAVLKPSETRGVSKVCVFCGNLLFS